jgi:hypothetical protein
MTRSLQPPRASQHEIHLPSSTPTDLNPMTTASTSQTALPS